MPKTRKSKRRGGAASNNSTMHRNDLLRIIEENFIMNAPLSPPSYIEQDMMIEAKKLSNIPEDERRLYILNDATGSINRMREYVANSLRSDLAEKYRLLYKEVVDLEPNPFMKAMREALYRSNYPQ
jgi:hypothetical protein